MDNRSSLAASGSKSHISTGAAVAGGAVLGGAAVAGGAYALKSDEVLDKEKDI